MNWKRGILTFLIVADVLAVNAGVGYLLYKFSFFNFQFSTNSDNQFLTEENKIPITDQLMAVDECGEKCKAYIDTKVAEVAGPSAQPVITLTPAPTAKVVTVTKTMPSSKTRSVQYVTIPGSGTSRANVWENLAGTEFYFDLADYPGLVEVYFEANMKLFNGNGMAFVQLYDATNGIGVQGSDVQTNSQSNSVVTSGRVSFWAGKNLIRVQAKSLTADTAVFNSGRLKIITEN